MTFHNPYIYNARRLQTSMDGLSRTARTSATPLRYTCVCSARSARSVRTHMTKSTAQVSMVHAYTNVYLYVYFIGDPAAVG